MLITYWLIAPITLSFFVNIVIKYNLNISLTFEREDSSNEHSKVSIK